MVGRWPGLRASNQSCGLRTGLLLVLSYCHPENARPCTASPPQNKRYAHAKHCYVITPSSKVHLRGCSEDMCSYLPRKNEVRSLGDCPCLAAALRKQGEAGLHGQVCSLLVIVAACWFPIACFQGHFRACDK